MSLVAFTFQGIQRERVPHKFVTAFFLLLPKMNPCICCLIFIGREIRKRNIKILSKIPTQIRQTLSMASTMNTYYGSGIVCQNLSTAVGLTLRLKPCPAVGVVVFTVNSRPWLSATVVVRAEGQTISPEIRKTEVKVVDSVVVTELSKTLTAYCRCWRSRTFLLCDGNHVKHNRAPGDNIGPSLLKKQ